MSPKKLTTAENLERLKQALTFIMQARAAHVAAAESNAAAIIDECDEYGINRSAAYEALEHNAQLCELGRDHAEKIWKFLEKDIHRTIP